MISRYADGWTTSTLIGSEAVVTSTSDRSGEARLRMFVEVSISTRTRGVLTSAIVTVISGSRPW